MQKLNAITRFYFEENLPANRENFLESPKELKPKNGLRLNRNFPITFSKTTLSANQRSARQITRCQPHGVRALRVPNYPWHFFINYSTSEKERAVLATLTLLLATEMASFGSWRLFCKRRGIK